MRHCELCQGTPTEILKCDHRRPRPWWRWLQLQPSCGSPQWIGAGSLRWRHNDHAGVSNLQPPGCLLNRLFRRKSKKTSKLRVTGLCAGNSPGTGEFSAQMASYAENISIWWRHHVSNFIPHLIHDRCNLSSTLGFKCNHISKGGPSRILDYRC